MVSEHPARLACASVAYTWPVDRTQLPGLPDPDDDGYDAAVARRNAAEDMAVSVLWALSGRQFGVAETTIRPATNPSVFVWQRTYGHWAETPCGCAAGCCVVAAPRVVHLPGPAQPDTDTTPITVTVAGTDLTHTDYSLEGDCLYRAGGKEWPRQDFNRPLGEPGTWSVTYWRGLAPPAVVAPLVGQLAREFLTAIGDDPSECRLPATLTQMTRQGVTHVFDPARILAAGYTGLTEIDRWLAAVNPHRLAQAPVVL